MNIVTKDRACLIICETKYKANKIYEELINYKGKEFKKGDILLYTRDDNYEIRSV